MNEQPTLASLLSLKNVDLLKLGALLAGRTGGLEALTFLVLFATMLADEAKQPVPRRLSICLRERDFSYFAIEEWLPFVHGLHAFGTGVVPAISHSCVPFEGEIPAVYLVDASFSNAPASELPGDPPRGFLALLDFVAKTTGSGLAIRLRTTNLDPRPVSEVATDLRNGLRVRYRWRPVGAPLEFPPFGTTYWVERVTSGRGPGSIASRD